MQELKDEVCSPFLGRKNSDTNKDSGWKCNARSEEGMLKLELFHETIKIKDIT